MIRAKNWINSLPEYIPGKTLEEIKEKYNLSIVYKLASNENIFGPAKNVIKLISESADITKYYPDADSRDIKKTLSEVLKVEKSSLIMGNGTDQIIEMLCDCFIDHDTSIVIADPTFLIYEKATLKNNGIVIKVPLDDFKHDIKAMVGAVREDTRIVFLTNPHNPTGTAIPSQDLEYAFKNIPENVLVVIDEAYFEYLDDDHVVDTVRYQSDYDNIVILRTFSKIYGLAGLRIGYGIANQDVIALLEKVRLPFNVNLLAQRAAVEAFMNQQYIKDIRNKVEIEKEKFYNILDGSGAEYIRSFANFILIKVPGDDLGFSEELLKKGFIVRPGNNLGLPGYIRVTISLPEVNDKFLRAFKDIFKQRL